MIDLPTDTVLLVIDVQQAFDNPCWGERNNLCAESNIAALLAAWRGLNLPIVHVHHLNPSLESQFNADKPGFLVKDGARPMLGEPVLYKSVNSAFIGTGLERMLRARGTSKLVIVGLTTDHCVSTTARMAGNLGFSAFVVSDSTASFERTGPDGRHWDAQLMHDTALASLNKEFAAVVSTAEVLTSIARHGEEHNESADAALENLHA